MQILIELDKTTLTVQGNVDISNTKYLYDIFEQMMSLKDSLFTIDLRNVKHVDSAGINAIFWFANQISEEGKKLILKVHESGTTKLLRLVGLNELDNIKIISHCEEKQKDIDCEESIWLN